MKKILISFAALCCALTMSAAQTPVADEMNPLITSMPSLSIAPDARAAGLGDMDDLLDRNVLVEQIPEDSDEAGSGKESKDAK